MKKTRRGFWNALGLQLLKANASSIIARAIARIEKNAEPYAT
jgi:hypothetical protein